MLEPIWKKIATSLPFEFKRFFASQQSVVVVCGTTSANEGFKTDDRDSRSMKGGGWEARLKQV